LESALREKERKSDGHTETTVTPGIGTECIQWRTQVRTKLERVEEQLTRHASEKDAQFYRELSARVFGKASSGFLDNHDPETLAAILRGAHKFIKKKDPNEIRVRAMNPRYDVDGWDSSKTALEISMSDRPFIVDSVSHELRRMGLDVHSLVHPILRIQRNDEGRMIEAFDDQKGIPEVYELYLIEQVADDQHEELVSRVKAVLQDVKAATDDYKAMRKQVDELCTRLSTLSEKHQDDSQVTSIKECQEFLRWLDNHHFVFLGYREYDLHEDENGTKTLQVHPDSSLGILRDLSDSKYASPVPFEKISANLKERVTGGPPIIVTKANRESTVHRPVKLDYVGLKKFDDDFNLIGEVRFVGLFTSSALTTPVKDIPILRRRLEEVLRLDQATAGSHDFKQIVTIFNSMPREELFWSEADELHRDIRTIMAMQQEHDVRLALRPDPLHRGALVMVIMPRDRFNTEVRHRVQAHLEETFQADHVDYQLSMGEDEEQVRFHFFLTTDVELSSIDLPELESRVVDMTRTWNDRLNERLVATHGDAGLKMGENFFRSFPEGYMANTSFGMAVKDIEGLIGRVSADEKYRVGIFNPSDSQFDEDASSVRIYHTHETLVLSEVLPILERLGLRVLQQSSHQLDFKHNGKMHSSTIDVFRVQERRSKQPVDLRAHQQALVAAMTALLNKTAENHPLNGLILSGGLTWREVALLRTYQAYLSQVQVSTSRQFIDRTMLAHPTCAAQIYRYFEAKFRPDFSDREQAMKQRREEFFDSLNTVSSLAFDSTLRALFNLVESTLRTNYFLNKGYISHKISSRHVLEMPEPRPLFEIVVVGRSMEGVHLRGGPVARGGLRWSDRPDDYRTEVLGLMKTQMTKNAVIVPVGSKGGFVIKNAPQNREALMAFVQEQYKTFIRGLLDLTDNNKGGKVLHPAGLVIYDQPDPYLVVAADKGTATFSDIANSVSAEYDFWLGDAFASGGSYGYDHKKEGITARGAWECVKRHFFELGLDVMNDEFSVVGIGDMSGDVFGNGLLYTDRIKLRAAFNHMHIFIDPNPDAAASYEERKRLFELPRSSWTDYDKSLISAGGGIFERASKAIKLSPEIKFMLGVEVDELNGQELIRTILKMPVDLLWNGGIGTYVRQSGETDADVGDSSNDAVRITAPELKARVVGEGGNQGFTQLGRIEFARMGGRINTDAIDNSAGVDMSDHEVNIKILLQPLVSHGDLTFDKRNDVLQSMTDEVSELVLKDNYWQSLCLSIAEMRSREDLELFSTLMDYLADRGALDKEVEFLPDPRAVQERMRAGAGFTRPELAIILAYTKMGIYRRILETDFPDEPLFQHYLLDYFPTLLRENYADRIRKHSLRREIIATQFTNVVVDLLGITFVHRTIRDTGATPIQVIRAGLAALELVDAKEFLGKLGEFDGKVSSQTFYEVLSGLVAALENVVNWILLTDADLSSLSQFISNYRVSLKDLRKGLHEILPSAQRERLAALKERFISMGYSEEFAGYVASLDYVPSGIGIVDNARIAEIPLPEAASRFYEVGETLRIAWLRDKLREVQTKDKWQTIAIVGLIMDLRQIQLRLSLTDVDLHRLPGNPVSRYEQFLNEIISEDAFGQASGDVLARLLAQIAEGARRKAIEGSVELEPVTA
jgi:glutamate dehydrogenase